MCDDFGVSNGGGIPGIGGTEKAAGGAPTRKRSCLRDGVGWYFVAFGWGSMPNGNILGKLLPGGGPAALNLWLKTGDTNEGGGIGIVGNGSRIFLSHLKK